MLTIDQLVWLNLLFSKKIVLMYMAEAVPDQTFPKLDIY